MKPMLRARFVRAGRIAGFLTLGAVTAPTLHAQAAGCECMAEALTRRLPASPYAGPGPADMPPEAAAALARAGDMFAGSYAAVGERLRAHPVAPGTGRLSISGIVSGGGSACVDHVGTSAMARGADDAAALAAGAEAQLQQLQRQLEALTGKSDPRDLTEQDLMRHGPALMQMAARLGDLTAASPAEDAVIHVSTPDALSYFFGMAAMGTALRAPPAGGWAANTAAALPLRVVGVAPAKLREGGEYPVANFIPGQVVYSSFRGSFDPSRGVPAQGVLTVAHAEPGALTGRLRVERLTAVSMTGTFQVEGPLTVEEVTLRDGEAVSRTQRTGSVHVTGGFEAPNWFTGALGGMHVVSRYGRAGRWSGSTARPAGAGGSPVCEPPASFTVAAHLPERGRENVAWTGAEIVVRFSEPFAFHTLEDRFRFGYLDAAGDSVDVGGSFERMDDDEFRFEPAQELRPGVIYHARIAGGARGVLSGAGARLPEDYVWTFSTIVEPDSVVPHVFQVARNAPLVPRKATATRAYAYWSAHEDVHPSRNVESFPARVRVVERPGVPLPEYAEQEVRIYRPDKYSEQERKRARNSVNFFGWYPPRAGGPPRLFAEIEPDDPYPASTQLEPFRGERRLTYSEYSPEIRLDYYFLRFAEWSDGVPEAQTRSGHQIARRAATFITQTFPVVETHVRAVGDLHIPRDVVGLLGGPDGLMRYLHDRAGPSSAGNVVVGFHPASFSMRVGLSGQGMSFFSDELNERCGIEQLNHFYYPTVRLDIPDDPAANPIMASTLAHEVGHAYGLSHRPPSCGFAEQAAICSRDGHGRHAGIEGFRIAASGRTGWNKSAREGNEESWGAVDFLLPLMFPCTLRPPEAYFMDNADYDVLLRTVGWYQRRAQRLGEGPRYALRPAVRQAQPGSSGPADGYGAANEPAGPGRAAAPPPSRATSQRHVLVSGLMRRDHGAVSLFPVRTVPQGWGPETAAGDHVVELVDPDGRVVASRAFAFHPQDTSEWRYFSVVAPLSGELGGISVRVADRVLAGVRRSANAPSVRFVEPAPGTVVAGDAVVRWVGLDGDGDSLRYSLLYSPDGSTGWRHIAADHPADSLLIDTARLEPGEAPTLKVVASDGLHDAEAILSFRLANPLTPLTMLPAPVDTVNVHAEVMISFGTVVERSQLENGGFRLLDERGDEVAATVDFLPTARAAVLTPAAPLEPGAAYTAVLAAGTADTFGHRLPRDLRWTFHTRAGPEADR